MALAKKEACMALSDNRIAAVLILLPVVTDAHSLVQIKQTFVRYICRNNDSE